MKHGYIQYSNINNIINHMYMYAYNVYDFLFENQSQFYIYYTKNKFFDFEFKNTKQCHKPFLLGRGIFVRAILYTNVTVIPLQQVVKENVLEPALLERMLP